MISDAPFPHITALLLSLSAGIFAWFIGVVGYRAFFHPLAKVPGPPLAALTYFYIFYFNVGKTSRLYAHIEKLHERYGTLFQALQCLDCLLIAPMHRPRHTNLSKRYPPK